MKTQSESVTQTDDGSTSTENQENIETKDNEVMPDYLKKDFFKQKQQMNDAIAEREAMAEKVKAFEEAENERVGNHKKIIETLKEENAKLKGSLTANEKSKQIEKFNKTLTAKAEAMGFAKPDRVMNFLSDDDKALLVIDGDYNVDEYGMEKAFDNLKKDWGELFKPKSYKIADGAPKTNLNEQPKKSAKEMTTAERIAMVKEITKNK